MIQWEPIRIRGKLGIGEVVSTVSCRSGRQLYPVAMGWGLGPPSARARFAAHLAQGLRWGVVGGGWPA